MRKSKPTYFDLLTRETLITSLVNLDYKELLIKCNYFEKFPNLCEDNQLWLRKAAHDLHIDWHNSEFSEIFSLSELSPNLKSQKILSFYKYVRTLLYFGTIMPQSVDFIEKNYLAKIAMFADNIETFKSYLIPGGQNYLLGDLACYMGKYTYLLELMKSTDEFKMEWALELTLLSDIPEKEVEASITDFAYYEMNILIQVIDGDRVLDPIRDAELIEIYGEEIIKYTAITRGFDEAEQLGRGIMNRERLNLYLALAAILVGKNELVFGESKKFSVNWEDNLEELELYKVLAASENLYAFKNILKSLKNHKTEFISDVLSFQSSSNPIFNYIRENYSDTELGVNTFTVWQDLFSYTWVVRGLSETSLKSAYENIDENIKYENFQIVLRETQFRTVFRD